MMIGKMSWKARPMLREKNGDGLAEEDPLWRMCGAYEEVWNHTIVGNFRMPDEVALNAVLPRGKGDLGALGDPAATGVPKQTVLKFSDKRQRKKKTHEAVSVLSLVPEVAGILRTRFRKYEDYVVVTDTLEGLGVSGASTGAGRSTTSIKPVGDKKKKAAAVAGGEKVPKFRKTRTTVVPKLQTAGKLVKIREEPVSLFAAPPSSPKVVDVEVQKKGGESPSIEVVSGGGTPPSVHAEETSKKTAGETIVDTLDSSNSLIDRQEDGSNRGDKPNSPEKNFGSTIAGTGGEDQPSIHPGESELKFYYRSYAAKREILRGLGTPFETARARALPRQNRLNQLSSMLVGSSIIANVVMEDYNVLASREEETIWLRAEAEAMVKAAREGAEQLEKDKAAFEKLKQTERWAASAGFEHELNNLKAVNAALVKVKVAAEVATREAETRGVTALKEVEAHAAKVLEDTDADRTRLNKVVEEPQAEVQNRVTISEEVSSRASDPEARRGKLRKLEMGWPPL
ncbi:hypothetical protein Hanom_Chr12g01137591 [Helianthus anomalus]